MFTHVISLSYLLSTLYIVGPCNVSRPCQNGGTCYNIDTGGIGYFCECVRGYTGRECQFEPPSGPSGSPDSKFLHTCTAVCWQTFHLVVV